jgi:outer membrane protein assembly factor BamD (BamD/ComL family)
MKPFVFMVFVAATIFPLFDCASSTIKMVSFDSRMLQNADSLFYSGNFEEASKLYNKIRATRPKTKEAKIAHFQSAYLNIYYNNPNANWSKALKEFKSFASLYPNDPRIGEVFSWMRILTVIKSFDTQFRSSADQVERLKYLKKESLQSQRYVLDSMAVIIRNCYDSREVFRDSMTKVNAKLEDVIIDLEKKCQQVGR